MLTKQFTYLLFYLYVGVFVFAGAWGAFGGASYDQKLLFHLDISIIDEIPRASLLSQYRFLRAVELFFGIWLLIFTTEIFTVKKFNWLFLLLLGGGVMARIISLIVDGKPLLLFYFFLGYEIVAFLFIWLYTKSRIK